MRRTTLALNCLTAILAACGDGPTDPPVGGGVALVITPGALLLSEPGSTAHLQAVAVDADGDSTLVDATFQTSDAAIVSIGPDDVAVGGASLGSAQIVATSGELTSAPIIALRATAAAGALLIADSQIVGPMTPVDPAAPYGPGWRYRIRVRSTAPEPGQLLIGTGGLPLGGRVTSANSVGNGVEVVLELVPLADLLPNVSVRERLPLGTGVAPTSSARRTAGPAFSTRSLASTADDEITRGPFTCTVEAAAPLTFPLTLDAFSHEVHPDLDYDVEFVNGSLRRAIVEGSLSPRITANPLITAALDGKATCKAMVRQFPLPIGGILALFVGGQVPVGIGFQIRARAPFGQLGFDAFLDATISTRFGIECNGTCEVEGTAAIPSYDGYFKPRLPTDGWGPRLELSASAFVYGELKIGNPFFEEAQFKLLEARGGLEQKMELASRDVQAADPTYASSYELKPLVEAKIESTLASVGNLLALNLTGLNYTPELPALSRSPRGTLTITPASVAPGNEATLGERATFTVTLTDATYLLAYAVEGVEIRWRKPNGTEFVLDPGRPGCTDLEAAQDQLVFTCETDFLEEHAGEQTFHAFVKTRILGVPVPVPLEIAVDAKATVNVADATSLSLSPTAVTLARGATQQFTVAVGGAGGQGVTWQVTGGTYVTAGNVLTYTAGDTPGTYSVTATSVADPSRSAVATVEIVEPPGTGAFAILGVLPVSAGVSVGQCAQGQILQGLGTSMLAYQSPIWQCTANEPPTTIARANVGFSISGLTGSSVTISANGSVHLRQSAADEWVATGATNEGFLFRVTGGTIPFRLSGTLTAAADGYAEARLTGIELTRRATAESGPINVDESGLLPPGDYSFDLKAGNVNSNIDADGGFNLTLKLGQ